MVKLTFKEVGQGDSIIIEWSKEEKEFIGFIDCNLKPGKINPSLKYLQSTSYQTIEFIILSHPHDDHYSGLNELLLYCESKGIVIKKFYHTCHSVPVFLKSADSFKLFLKSVVFSAEARKEIYKMFHTIKRLKHLNIIEKVPPITDETKEIVLADGFKLDFLSPSDTEYDTYNSLAHKMNPVVKSNNPDANYLSTVITIYNENYSILLTSDAVTAALKRLGLRATKRLGNNLSLAQIPHHGALANFYKAFWKNRSIPKGMPAVISVGENFYEHPSLEAIESLQKLGATIYLTNSVDSCRVPEALEVATYLNWVSGSTEPIDNILAKSYSKDIVCYLNEHAVVI